MPSGSERLLFAILVYNGRDVVLSCLESAVRMRSASSLDIELLVLDDCSPEPGWSEELAGLCETIEVGYYRSPRNLGIPRNMNLGLRYGSEGGHDGVVLLNSDVVCPANLADAMAAALADTPAAGSLTAWSNNVSIFSLPHSDPTKLTEQDTVDIVSSALRDEFGSESVEIPVGVGFCMLIPVAAIEAVGLMDPVFGKGYCEEVDWSRRAAERGLRNVLVPGAFAYHVGNVSASEAGLLSSGAKTVWGHEAIVDLRHPDYRDVLASFDAANPMPATIERGLLAVVASAARRHGYTIEAASLRRDRTDDKVRFVVEPDGFRSVVRGCFRGFEAAVPTDGGPVVEAVRTLVGHDPDEISIFEPGRVAEALRCEATAMGLSVAGVAGYPERI